MKKLIKNNNGAMIILSGVILLIALMSVELLFYQDNSINTERELGEVETGWLGAVTGFFDMVFNGVSTLWETMSFQSNILLGLGLFGVIIGLVIWALLIIGLIDILWIG